jgi:hypothetical protein
MSAKVRCRPNRVTYAALLVGLLGAVSVVRATRAWQEADLYAALGVSYPALLEIVLSAIWGVAHLGVGWGLWELRAWARRAALILLPAYGIFSIAWLAVFARSDYDTGRLPFLALTSALAVLLLLWMLTGRRVREAFAPSADGDLDDRHRP